MVAVWTHADISELPPVDFRDAAAQNLRPYRQPLLAHGVVRYVGEPIAVVFATDAYLAEDAAALVELDAETLPPVLDAAAAPGVFAPGLSTGATVLQTSYGDVAGAFAAAHLIVSLELDIGRHSGVPIETRGAIARYEPGQDRLELYGAAKIPHRNRDTIARFFERPAASVVLRELHVGGGFGVRGELYPEDFLVCAAAMRLGRPIKWIEDRYEHLMATNHSRQQHHRARMAVDADGQVLALDDVFHLDQGAYVRTHAARVVDMTISMLPGPYRIPAFSAVGHFRLTNKTPAATYRAPGHYESSFVRERLMDVVADRLGIDGVELRRRNLIGAEEMPFHRPIISHGIPTVHDSGDYRALLERALDRFGWDAVQEKLRARRAGGELVGAGFVMFLEKGGVGPRDGARVTAVDTGGAGRTGDRRRRVCGSGLRDRDGPNLRGCAGGGLSPRAGGARADRSHPVRHRRARLARHGDDRRGDARSGAGGAGEGARGRRAAVAGRGRVARYRRWQRGADGRQRRGNRAG